jgi:RNA recognition motif-containing protein
MSLFVGNLPYSLTTEEFRAAFDQFGPISDAKIATEFYSGRRRSRGYGFIDFEDPATLDACLQSGVRIVLKDRELLYRAARPNPVIKDLALVSGLPGEATDQDLAVHFAAFAPIETRIVHAATGGRPGFGFAKFASEEARDRAIAGLNGSVLLQSEIVVKPASRPFRSEEEQRNRRR